MKSTETSQFLIYKVIAYKDGGKYQLAYDELKKNK